MILSPRFDQALGYVTILHSGQTRKGTAVPYIAHLLAVAGIALDYGATEDEAVAALLHDAVEDAGGRRRLYDIRCRFGQAVADVVAGCSDAVGAPKPPWRERKEAYLRRLAEAPSPVVLVAAADKLHNVRSLLADYRACGEAVWGRFKGGREGTLWYCRSLVEALSRPPDLPDGTRRLVEELGRVVGDLEAAAAGGRPSGEAPPRPS